MSKMNAVSERDALYRADAYDVLAFWFQWGFALYCILAVAVGTILFDVVPYARDVIYGAIILSLSCVAASAVFTCLSGGITERLALRGVWTRSVADLRDRWPTGYVCPVHSSPVIFYIGYDAPCWHEGPPDATGLLCADCLSDVGQPAIGYMRFRDVYPYHCDIV